MLVPFGIAAFHRRDPTICSDVHYPLAQLRQKMLGSSSDTMASNLGSDHRACARSPYAPNSYSSPATQVGLLSQQQEKTRLSEIMTRQGNEFSPSLESYAAIMNTAMTKHHLMATGTVTFAIIGITFYIYRVRSALCNRIGYVMHKIWMSAPHLSLSRLVSERINGAAAKSIFWARLYRCSPKIKFDAVIY